MKAGGGMVSVGEREVARCERAVSRPTLTEVVLTCPPSLPFDDINVVNTNERLLRETMELSLSHV